ncbi:MAG TPA: TetR family transcriptional regulator [Candidatus Chromulinivoraceae bacterium]|nr:TetR family transcriptional regulator [Candidatus Chromulinivoraceae bacterium]
MQLFTEHGYAQTTVEQIAEAAEVSPSTFFRYFNTKEAVILYDNIDPIIIGAFMRQSPDTPTIRAMRNAVQELSDTLPKEKKRLELQRFELLNSDQTLRNKAFGETAASIDAFAGIIAQRTGKNTDDIAVRNLAGAIIGVMVAVLQQSYKQPSMAIFEGGMDAALARLEQGLEL